MFEKWFPGSGVGWGSGRQAWPSRVSNAHVCHPQALSARPAWGPGVPESSLWAAFYLYVDQGGPTGVWIHGEAQPEAGCVLGAAPGPKRARPVPTPSPKGKNSFRPVTLGCLPVPQLARSWQDPVGVQMREGNSAEGAPAAGVHSA